MLQTVLFPKSKFSVHDASMWLTQHKYYSGKVDAGKDYWRFRQRTPHGGSYYTVTLPSGVEMVYEKSVF
jgi:hypothetical protein